MQNDGDQRVHDTGDCRHGDRTDRRAPLTAQDAGHAPAAMALVAVTDVGGMTHLVTDVAMTAGRRAGCFRAVCGCHVLAASLTTPESGRCQLCRQWRAGQ